MTNKPPCECEFCKMYDRVKIKEDSWDVETKQIVEDLWEACESDSINASYWKSKYYGNWIVVDPKREIEILKESIKKLEKQLLDSPSVTSK
jgi:hypothetical protein